MAVVQLRSFALRAGADPDAWLQADQEAQAVAHVQPGLLRRTTARAADGSGSWLVVELWRSEADADARAPDPAADWADPATVTVERYVDIGG